MLDAFRIARWVCACSLSITVACGSKVANASFEITNPGSGQANAESLFPLHDGSVFSAGPGNPGLTTGIGASLPIQPGNVVDGSVQFNGALAVRYVERTTGLVTYLTETADGWLELGTTEDGPYAHATLLVPKTVKVGMTWTSTPDDQRHYQYEVLSRDEKDTPYGHKPVWVVQQTGVETQTLIARTYVEGRGLWRIDFLDGLGGAPVVNDRAVVVLSGDVPAPPAPHPLSMVELPVSGATLADLVKQLGVGFEVNLVQGRTGPPLLMGEGAYGSALQLNYTPLCATVSSAGIAPGKYAHSPFGLITDTSTCPTVTVATGNGANTIDLLNGHADGAMATDAGIFWLSRQQSGETHYYLPDPGDGQTPLGVLSTPAGGAAYVGLDSPGYPDHVVVLGDGILEPRIADRWAANTRVYPRALTLGPIASTRSMLLQTNDGTVYSGTASLTSVSELHRERGFAGIWSVGSTAAGTGVFRLLQDGTADRLVLSPTGLELQRAGEVQLPAGQSLIGLFEATLDATPVVLAVTLELTAQPHAIGSDPFYALHVFKVTQALGATPLVRGPAFGVQVVDLPGLYHDVEACWPPGLGPPVLTGWTLGGNPATAVPATPDGTCVVVLRDRSLPQPPRLTNGSFVPPLGYDALEGTIPGVGPMAFAGPFVNLHTPDAIADGTTWAPLSGGGFVAGEALLDEGGQAFDATTPFLEEAGHPRMDLAGHGVWLTKDSTPFGTVPDTLWLRGTTMAQIPLPAAGSPSSKRRVTTLASIPGGGVAIELAPTDGSSAAAQYLVFPDGTSKPLPPHARTLCGVLADGTACATDGAGMTCVGPTGTAVPVATAGHLALDCAPWLALSDGTFTAPATDTVTGVKSTLRVTPTTGATSLYDARQYQAPTWSPDGVPYAMAFSLLGAFDAVPVQATATGFVELPIPANWKLLLYSSDQQSGPYLVRVDVGVQLVTVYADIRYARQSLAFRLPRR
jgi:hypothetical protein